jgi:hypothetical protein
VKTKRTVWWLTLFAACNVMAQQQQTEPPTTIFSRASTMNISKSDIHWLATARPAQWRISREPVGGLSPQAWTTIAGWHPPQSALPDDKNSSPEMPLIWFGQAPWQ